ncbi:MAG TPA: hypothetical protein VG994_02720 [Steroidobacteraceae bacterium]|nr:hypothetical protein [Steroidobacteraceae bacterium]
MTITVTPLSTTRVLVVREPSIAARIICGRRSTSEIAELRGCYWATAAGWVGRDTEAAIAAATGRS